MLAKGQNFKQLLWIYNNCIEDFWEVIKVVSKESVNLLARISQGISYISNKVDK